MANNNSRFVPNNNNSGSKSAEELTKRYLDAVLKSQCSPNDNSSSKSDDEEMENEDIVVSMTPPTSPHLSDSLRRSESRHSKSNAAATTTLRDKSLSIPVTESMTSTHRSQGQGKLQATFFRNKFSFRHAKYSSEYSKNYFDSNMILF